MTARELKLAAWNINHRIHPKPIDPRLLDVLRDIAPDVLVLTEYVERDGRPDFKSKLRQLGLTSISVSEPREGHNQVLVATRAEHLQSGIRMPPGESHAETNFVAVVVPAFDVVIIGLRTPIYKTDAEQREYRAKLLQVLGGVPASDYVLAGDLNGDPDSPESKGGTVLREARKSGWSSASPVGDWSYKSPKGLTSRIDHVLVKGRAKVVAASYLTSVAGISIAGAPDALSDHAILQCTLAL